MIKNNENKTSYISYLCCCWAEAIGQNFIFDRLFWKRIFWLWKEIDFEIKEFQTLSKSSFSLFNVKSGKNKKKERTKKIAKIENKKFTRTVSVCWVKGKEVRMTKIGKMKTSFFLEQHKIERKNRERKHRKERKSGRNKPIFELKIVIPESNFSKKSFFKLSFTPFLFFLCSASSLKNKVISSNCWNFFSSSELQKICFSVSVEKIKKGRGPTLVFHASIIWALRK